MRQKYIIAIDGPAASGKSTTARLLARMLHYIYIDTGAMYRACALCSLQEHIDLSDRKSLLEMLENIKIDIIYSETGNRIFLNGTEVSEKIRSSEVTRLSSEIATIDIVREKMVILQRKIGEKGGIIMDGRDIGTVVFPDADFKFFMVADIEARARRRWSEMSEKGQNPDFDEILHEMEWRDRNDSQRDIGPLKKADDALIIDTTDMGIQQQAEYILQCVQKADDNKAC
ncbi:MAG: (d)CMP kinase [Candidatus Cloacimonetes bacterium]|nr:(d)CMP kinase [Candidatus Cloacimonadota bacterium]